MERQWEEFARLMHAATAAHQAGDEKASWEHAAQAQRVFAGILDGEDRAAAASRGRRSRRLVKLITRLILVTACFTAAFTAGTIAHASSASAAVTSHTSLWWDSATCRAWQAYERTGHGTDFHAMVTASRRADTYLRSDVALWAHDARAGASRTVLGTDAGYVALDCTTTGD
jgi:hypothetical protein